MIFEWLDETEAQGRAKIAQAEAQLGLLADVKTLMQGLSVSCGQCGAGILPAKVEPSRLGTHFYYLCECGAGQDWQLVLLGARAPQPILQNTEV